jgi:hypothetical protein
MSMYAIKHIARPRTVSVLGGGRQNITPWDILPHLPNEDCVFDCRHWVYETTDNIMPFSVTTRIGANNQQYVKLYE